MAEIKYLDTVVFPALKNRNFVKILVLPSSNGAESITLAQMLKDFGIEDFLIVGVDIQPTMISIARSGRIPILEVNVRTSIFNVPPSIQEKLTYEVGDVFSHELDKDFDLIFCRNFLSYFNLSGKNEILERISRFTFNRWFNICRSLC